MKLAGKVAIVTGTSPNIGGGIAEGLAAEGAAIVAVDAKPANAKDCAVYIEKSGGRATGVACDVTDEGQVAAAVGAAVFLASDNAGMITGTDLRARGQQRAHRQRPRPPAERVT